MPVMAAEPRITVQELRRCRGLRPTCLKSPDLRKGGSDTEPLLVSAGTWPPWSHKSRGRPLWFLGRYRDTRDLHVDGEQVGPGSEIEGFPVVTAKAHVRCRGLPMDDAAELCALRIQYPESARTAAIDIPLLIHLHAVGHTGLAAAQIREHPVRLLREQAIRQHVKGPDVVAPGIGNVEHPFVGGERQP